MSLPAFVRRLVPLACVLLALLPSCRSGSKDSCEQELDESRTSPPPSALSASRTIQKDLSGIEKNCASTSNAALKQKAEETKSRLRASLAEAEQLDHVAEDKVRAQKFLATDAPYAFEMLEQAEDILLHRPGGANAKQDVLRKLGKADQAVFLSTGIKDEEAVTKRKELVGSLERFKKKHAAFLAAARSQEDAD